MNSSTLSPEEWDRVHELFSLVLEQPLESRGAFLDEKCGGDPALRAAVSSLLSAHEREGLLLTDKKLSEQVQERIARAIADRYEVTAPLGSGGMANVFIANDLKHGRQVAVKVLRPDLGFSLGIDRFQREIEIAAALQHPHILPLFDSGSADRLFYYVMPYVEGETLADRLDRDGALPEAEAIQIADEVLGALEYAHQQGVVHRDIKPSNILLSKTTGHALVADFGIARAVSAAGHETLTAPGAVIGTPGYMPPEQARGERITSSTDLYAMGLVLFESLTGQSAPTVRELESTDWSGLGSHRPAIVRALQVDPSKRWDSAGAFRDALKKSSRSPITSWKTVAVAVAIAVAGIFGWLSRSTSSAGNAVDASRLAVLPFTVRGGPDLQYLSEGMVDLFSTKLNGAGSLRTVEPRAVLGLVKREGLDSFDNSAVGQRVATQLNAGLFLLGDVTEVGGRVQITASLFDGTNPEESVARATAEGGEEDVLALLDEMAADLLSQHGLGGDQRLARIAVVTSQSLPALKAYLRGVRALRAAEFPVAAEAFQEAISEDSAFALAWYQLSITADWLMRAGLAQEAADQAVRFGSRLSERDGRLLEALGVIRRGDMETAERLLEAVIRIYPDDIEAWSQLAELLFHFGPRHGKPLEESRQAWQRFNELEPGVPTGYVHLARVEAFAHNLEALDTLSRVALELAPQGDRGLEMRALRAAIGISDADLDLLLADLAQAPEDLLAEAIWSIATFSREQTIIDPVIEVAKGSTRTEIGRATGYEWAANHLASLGQWEAAWATIDTMKTIAPVRGMEASGALTIAASLIGDTSNVPTLLAELEESDWLQVPNTILRSVWYTVHDNVHEHLRWYLTGVLRAIMGDESGAQEAIQRLNSLEVPAGSGSLIPDLTNGILATVARRNGDAEAGRAAIESLEGHIWHQVATASPFFSEGYQRFLRAMSLEASGQLEEAIVWYESFLGTGMHDVIFHAPANARMARLHQTLGNDEDARTHYQNFIQMWENADPIHQAEITAAKRQLEILNR